MRRRWAIIRFRVAAGLAGRLTPPPAVAPTDIHALAVLAARAEVTDRIVDKVDVRVNPSTRPVSIERLVVIPRPVTTSSLSETNIKLHNHKQYMYFGKGRGTRFGVWIS